eukprot:COSAG05_NODE_4354_length_1553_cov_0.925722_1_plen_139_part_10
MKKRRGHRNKHNRDRGRDTEPGSSRDSRAGAWKDRTRVLAAVAEPAAATINEGGCTGASSSRRRRRRRRSRRSRSRSLRSRSSEDRGEMEMERERFKNLAAPQADAEQGGVKKTQRTSTQLQQVRRIPAARGWRYTGQA